MNLTESGLTRTNATLIKKIHFKASAKSNPEDIQTIRFSNDADDLMLFIGKDYVLLQDTSMSMARGDIHIKPLWNVLDTVRA